MCCSALFVFSLKKCCSKAKNVEEEWLARQQAAASAKRWSEGQALSPIDGVPVALKDNFCEKGVPTTACSNILRGFAPPYEGTVVRHSPVGST